MEEIKDKIFQGYSGLAQGARIRMCTTLKCYAKRQKLWKILVPPSKKKGCMCTPGTPISFDSTILIDFDKMKNYGNEKSSLHRPLDSKKTPRFG